ncbi:pilus assembly protein TadG-related protein [Sandarakinorhabdus oryzae]|uniref:pilus assembly protein TadG-related protein n=1 Tax=Sandarakinorhabdus oryzae TaxID=2675220 RepID=UPI0012E2B7F2|nr:pilus assembly protein TadG-related protein [Sandarakinorhabdus oryzae]
MGGFSVRRLRSSRQGNVVTLTALMMPILIGTAGLASDTIQWTLTKRMMQRAADSGAIAGAYQLSQSSSTDVVKAAVTTDINRNAGFSMTVAPVINTPATYGSYRDASSAVEVTLATDARLPFTSMIMRGPVRISARAVAEVVGNGDYCVLALEKTNTTGISMNGNATVNLGCGMMSNAPSTASVTAGGSSQITASPVAAVGNVPASNNYGPGTIRQEYALPLRDPFRNLPDPNISANGSALSVNPQQTRSYTSNFTTGTVYNSVDIKGVANFGPGIYYITGNMSVNSGATINADGAVFILTARNAASNTGSIATVTINGGANVNMTAPTTAQSSTYAGLLFYQDRRATNMATNKINGNSGSKLQGAFYFPAQQLQMNGTAGMDTKCVQIVARQVDWVGNTAINNVCPPASGASSFKGTQIKLVA